MHVLMYLSLILHSSFSLYPSVCSSFLSSRHEIVSYLFIILLLMLLYHCNLSFRNKLGNLEDQHEVICTYKPFIIIEKYIVYVIDVTGCPCCLPLKHLTQHFETIQKMSI